MAKENAISAARESPVSRIQAHFRSDNSSAASPLPVRCQTLLQCTRPFVFQCGMAIVFWVRFLPPPLDVMVSPDHSWPVSSVGRRGETGHFHARRNGQGRISGDARGQVGMRPGIRPARTGAAVADHQNASRQPFPKRAIVGVQRPQLIR